MFTVPKGQFVLGRARVVIQNGNESTPRVHECEMIAAGEMAGFFMKRWIRRAARKVGIYMALIALAMNFSQQSPTFDPTVHMPMMLGVITSAVANSFKVEVLTKVHNLSNGQDVIKCALYTSSAVLGSGTTAYSATNEISGTGYSAGGTTVTSSTPVLSGSTAIYDLTDASWTTSTFTANGCLVYNSTATNKAMFVIAFGADFSVSSGTFTIVWPTADATNAILRLA